MRLSLKMGQEKRSSDTLIGMTAMTGLPRTMGRNSEQDGRNFKMKYETVACSQYERCTENIKAGNLQQYLSVRHGDFGHDYRVVEEEGENL